MKYSYELKDWLIDWNNLLEATSTIPVEGASPHLQQVFCARYPDVREAQWKCNRCLAALRYMEANKEPFEKVGLLLASSKGGTVFYDLSMALCGFFGQVDEAEVSTPPRAEIFIQTLEKFHRLTD